MTNQELQAYIAGKIHRSDLAAELPGFIEAARVNINRRFGLSLVAFVNPADTNAVLSDWPDLYQFDALRAAYEWLNDGPNAQYYGQRWNQVCNSQNITSLAAATDNYSDKPLQIKVDNNGT